MAEFKVGLPCKHGHGTLRYSWGGCVECYRARAKERSRKKYAETPEQCRLEQRKWAAANREKIRAANKRWSADNAEKKAASFKRWREANREKVLADKKAYYAANKERFLLTQKQWREENAERVKARIAIWREDNPEKFKAQGARRRARKRAAPGSHTGEDIAEILRLQRHRCAYCRRRLGRDYDVDHIVALARGGSNARSNLQVLCPPCNHRKHDLDPIVFAQRSGRLI